MPSRLVSVLIVAFWLAVTAWLFYREVWQPAGQPPPFALDLADEAGLPIAPPRGGAGGAGDGITNQEAGATAVVWDVEYRGQLAGNALTWVNRRPDRIYEIRFAFQPQPAFRAGKLRVRELTGAYRITPRGVLRNLICRVALGPRKALRQAEVSATVDGTMCRVRLVADGMDQHAPPVEVAANGKVLNVLHPLHRLTGLHEGMAWRVPLLDPLADTAADGGPRLTVRIADAAVTLATLPWQNADLPCWRVEYRTAGRVVARLWARADDGAVLRQEILYPDGDVVVQRAVFK
ncbi:MAG: hypothetical protein IT429_25465 [Gemmataceae bacterium]|nr:hypothetical protein [Gemmataceae bacterium]